MHLVTDFWTGNTYTEEVISAPEQSQIEASIARLDADRFTQVILSVGEEDFLLVGGGNGRFNICVGQSDDQYYTLMDLAKPPHAIEQLVTGGQQGNFPAQSIVSIQLATRAMQTYFNENGKMDTGLKWSKDQTSHPRPLSRGSSSIPWIGASSLYLRRGRGVRSNIGFSDSHFHLFPE